MDTIKRIVFWLLEGTRGGNTRVQLLSLLIEKPRNLNQLASASGFDYKTVEHHIRLLEKNQIIESGGVGYGKVYFISDAAHAVVAQTMQDLRGGLNGKKK